MRLYFSNIVDVHDSALLFACMQLHSLLQWYCDFIIASSFTPTLLAICDSVIRVLKGYTVEWDVNAYDDSY